MRILAVENPTEDLAASERVMEVIHGLRPANPDLDIEVTTLAAAEATRRRFAETVDGRRLRHRPLRRARSLRRRSIRRDSAVVLADGRSTDEQVLKLRVEATPVRRVEQQLRVGAGRAGYADRLQRAAQQRAGVGVPVTRRRGLPRPLLLRRRHLGGRVQRDASTRRSCGERNVGRAVQEARRAGDRSLRRRVRSHRLGRRVLRRRRHRPTTRPGDCQLNGGRDE